MPMTTYERILQAAKQEFLAHGFDGTGMRTIADRVGISATALYRHFKDKETLFEATLAPLLEMIHQLENSELDTAYRQISAETLDHIWDEMATDTVKSMMERFPDELKLLICCSKGTKFESFPEEIARTDMDEMLAFLKKAKEAGHPVSLPDPAEARLLSKSYWNAIFEAVRQDFTQAEADHYLDTVRNFFTPSFQRLFTEN